MRSSERQQQWTWSLAVVVLATACLVVLPGTATADKADKLDKEIAKQEKRLLSSLRSLLKWSANKRISGFRHVLYGRVLTLKPNDRSARRALGYTREGSGRWKRDPDYTAPKNWDLRRVKEGEQRLEKLYTAYRDKVVAAMEACDDLDSGRRSRIVDRVLELYPEDTTLREARGEIEYDGRWVLPETIDAIERREEIAEHVSQLWKRAQNKIRRDREEQDRGWTAAYKLEGRDIVGMVSDREVRTSILYLVVGYKAMSDVLDMELKGDKIIGPTSAILLPDRKSARVVARLNNYGKKTRTQMEVVSGLYLEDGKTVMLYGRDATKRMLGPLSYAIGAHISVRFNWPERGWLREGLRQRLIYLVSGKHGAHQISMRATEQYTGDDDTVLPDDPDEWLEAAAQLLYEKGEARVARVLTARLNAMTSADVLVAYGLAAYLIEARPDLAFDFMLATTKGHNVAAIVKKHLGADLTTVVDRLRVWLKQQN